MRMRSLTVIPVPPTDKLGSILTHILHLPKKVPVTVMLAGKTSGNGLPLKVRHRAMVRQGGGSPVRRLRVGWSSSRHCCGFVAAAHIPPFTGWH